MKTKSNLFILYLVLFSLGAILYFLVNPNTAKISQSAFTTQFDAHGGKFAFLHKLGQSDYRVILFDTKSNDTTVFGSPSAIPRSPRFSKDGEFLYFANTPPGRRISDLDELTQEELTSTLKKCSVKTGECRSLLGYTGEITSIVDLADGSLLFAGGQPEVRADPFSPESTYLGFRRYDFYHWNSSSSLQKISDLEAHYLNSASISGGDLLFEMPQKSELRKKHGKFNSRIHHANFVRGTSEVGLNYKVEKPFMTHGDRLNLSPNLAPDGKHVVFKSARSSKSGYIYDFVVAELPGKDVTNVIVSSKRGNANTVSRAVFVDNDTFTYMSRDVRSYYLWSQKINANAPELVATLSFRDIKAALTN